MLPLPVRLTLVVGTSISSSESRKFVTGGASMSIEVTAVSGISGGDERS